MANEATFVQGNWEKNLHEVTVADGTGLEKGTVMVYSSDPNTCTASSGDGDLFAGILAQEKVASDGQTRVGLVNDGTVSLVVATGGSATLGKPVKISGANTITVADSTAFDDSAELVGMSLETGSSGERINVKLRGY